jgi:Divergent InlB B-repeat domain
VRNRVSWSKGKGIARLGSVAAVSTVISVLASISAPAAQEIPVLTTSAGEFQPARGASHLAWEQNSKGQPRHFDVFVRTDDGTTTRINRGRSNAAMGGIDRDRLVFQSFRKKRSNLVFYDLATGGYTRPPKRVNSRHWEYWPSLSHPWLFFGRLFRNGSRQLLLYHLDSGEARVLAKTKGKEAFVGPGQVNGTYVTWSTCRRRCNVFRYDIATDRRERLENPGAHQRAPSVTPGGTVYFSRGGKRCGSSVRLVKAPIDRPQEVLVTLPEVIDVRDTYVHTEPDGATEVFYERSGCGRATASDIFKIRDTTVATLSVTKIGPGSGAVISAPPGISCGIDCTEDFEAGTTVTLEAFPSQGSVFVGWTGACSGGAPSCVVTMDGAHSVTAEFAASPTMGTIIVRKVTDPPGGGPFTFTGDVSGQISHGDQLVRSLPPGTYDSTELEPPKYDLEEIDCDDSDSTGDVGQETATFRLQAGETVTCTFENERS